jgi:hypothetical protein
MTGQKPARNLLIAGLLVCWSSLLMATDGHFLYGAGPVNEAMGGADTGICLDATGSIAWNPACTTQFKGRRFEFHGTGFAAWRGDCSAKRTNLDTSSFCERVKESCKTTRHGAYTGSEPT